MGGMLVDSKNDCCCPEMRCCTPTTVTATVSGMAGQTWRGPTHFRPFAPKPLADDGIEGGECYVCNDSYFLHSIMDAMALNGRQTGTLESMNLFSPFFDWLCYNSDPNNPWPPASFPPATALFREPGCEPFDMYGDPVDCNVSWQWVLFYYSYGSQLLNAEVTQWIVNNTLCEIDGKLCQRPDPDGLHAGPCNGLQQVQLSYEADLNGTYILHRPELYLRPQLKCRVNRQVPITDSPYRGVTEAQLLYNVDPPREWYYRSENVPEPNECWDVLFPPEGDDYCVDYRCGKRNPWYSDSGFTYCARGKCTATNQGVVKPHLYYYNEGLQNATSIEDVLQMQSANLYLKLVPKDYEQDEHGRFPTWWQVGGVEILDGGYGYEVGEFFQVDFASPEMRPWLGGEIMTLFPYVDPDCLLPTYPTWTDAYGYGGSLETIDNSPIGWKLFQRIRISSVDENGAITAIEVVPIYKHDEYADAPICLTPKSPEKRRKFYVGYGRVLCHPRSVQFGGLGYNVGDTIEFYCDDPACEELEPAIARVVDVDEEGAILDWEIRGTDAWRYNSMNFCVSPFTVVDGVCVTSCIKEGEPDERGKYRWKANLLCDLTWEGIGVPARGAIVGLMEGALRPPCLDSHPTWEYEQNTSGLTTLTLRIARQACETSIEAYVYPTPFVQAEGGVERVKFLFPAYPECPGGGAVVRPLFGPAGGNESDFGSYLAGGVVEAGGQGYCFRDKYHTEPVLPTEIPNIGDGTGASIGGFTFSAVHDFPNPAIDWGGDAPAYNRFSYFPVTAATVASAGSGYEVGQEFEVAPTGGRAVTDMWRATGGDTPDECPNGAWYDGERAMLNNDGYLSILYNYETGQYNEPRSQRPSKCRLRISGVDANGGITSLEVVHGGMMFKTAYGSGKKNPLVLVWLFSTLGYGAYIESTFDTDHESDTFGHLLEVSVVDPPEGTGDPKHPGVPDGNGGWIETPGLMPTGGRDYADQSAGYFWMLQNTQVGNPVCPPWQLLAHLGWGGRTAVSGQVNPSPPDGDVSEPRSPRNYFHEAYSTHNILLGSVPFVPMSSVCAFSDCYHDLLTRSYPLCKVWGGACPQNGVDGPGSPIGLDGSGGPATGYALLCKKGKNPSAQYGDPTLALGSDYVVIEHGPQLSLGYTTPSPCPDHSNGTTTRE